VYTIWWSPPTDEASAAVETTTDDRGGIRAAVRQVCAGFGDAYWRQHDEAGESPWEFYDAIAASGAGMNRCNALHLSVFGTHPISAYGSEEMKRRYLPRAASGELHVALGVTEPDAGSDTARITTRAVRDGDRHIVRGQHTAALALPRSTTSRDIGARPACSGWRRSRRRWRSTTSANRSSACRGGTNRGRHGLRLLVVDERQPIGKPSNGQVERA
jgi:alkylation response protein AidB-like acyl-CoA dehydrogenase